VIRKINVEDIIHIVRLIKNPQDLQAPKHIATIPIKENNTNGTIIPLRISSSLSNGRIKINHFGSSDLVITFITLLYFLFNFYFILFSQKLGKKKITNSGYLIYIYRLYLY